MNSEAGARHRKEKTVLLSSNGSAVKQQIQIVKINPVFASSWSSMEGEFGSAANQGNFPPSSAACQAHGIADIRKQHVVLAEDNPGDVFLVREAIDMYSLAVQLSTVDDGEQAVQLIEDAEQDPATPCPELLLLDLNLPKRSGLDVLKRLRQSEKCKHIPVLILTSSDSPQDRNAAARLGANHYFRKPSSYDQFVQVGEILRDLLARL